MVITIEITVDGETVARTIDSNELSLGFLEDMEAAGESGKWRDLIQALATMLGLTRAQARQITRRQYHDMLAAIKSASQVDPTPA